MAAVVKKTIVSKFSHASFCTLSKAKPSVSKDLLKRLTDEGFSEQAASFIKKNIDSAIREAKYLEYTYRFSNFSTNFLKAGAWSLVLSLGYAVASAPSHGEDK